MVSLPGCYTGLDPSLGTFAQEGADSEAESEAASESEGANLQEDESESSVTEGLQEVDASTSNAVQISTTSGFATQTSTSNGAGLTTSTTGDLDPTVSASSEETGGPPMPLAVDARGIHIGAIEANQGVAIALFKEGQVVDPTARNAELVSGRNTLLRATWELEAAWQPREITATLTLHASDGTSESFEHTRLVEAVSNTRDLEGTFHWSVPPEWMTSDVEYSVALTENAANATAQPAPTEPPRVPAEGSVPLGVRFEPMRLNLVMVPLATPDGTLDVTEELKQQTYDAFFSGFPVAELNIEWQSPYSIPTRLNNEDDGFALLRDLWNQDGAGPDTYYHLLLDPATCCDNSNGKFAWAGIGMVAEMADPRWASQAHLALSMVENYEYGYSTGTMIHEVGHNFGRPHAPCGGPQGPDPSYPSTGDYAQAGIGTQGFNIVSEELYNPFPEMETRWDQPYKDAMSYCWPQWWSDYNWQNNIDRVREVTSWANQLRLASEPVEALRVYIDAQHQARWSVITMEGGAVTDSLRRTATVFARDGRDFELDVEILEVADGDAHVVLIPLPEGVSAARAEFEFEGETFIFDAPPAP